jgi:hypothetical protein
MMVGIIKMCTSKIIIWLGGKKMLVNEYQHIWYHWYTYNLLKCKKLYHKLHLYFKTCI